MISLLFLCVAMPDKETYMAGRDVSLPTTVQETWNASEYLSAVGKDWKTAVMEKTKNNN